MSTLIISRSFSCCLIDALNMTVATGIINGLILYSNVISIDGCVFPLAKFFSGVTSLLNLQIRMDTCFFVGMDRFLEKMASVDISHT